MGALGDKLRETREGKGLSLEQVEEVTHIRRAFLQALEEERFDALPGEVYVKGFLRNYARFLNLNPEEVMAAYNASSHSAMGAGIPHVLNEPLVHSTGGGGRTYALAILAVVILGLAAWVGYSYFYRGVNVWPLNLILGSSQASTVPSPEPTETVPIIDEPTEAPTFTPPSEETAPAEATEAVESPTATPTPTLARPTNTRRPTATPTIAPTPGDSLTPTAATSIVVEARILATSYVRVIADGEQVMERNLRVGEDQIWTANESLSIRVGNGAGVELTVNGVPVPALGAQGEVVDVNYTLDTLPTPAP